MSNIADDLLPTVFANGLTFVYKVDFVIAQLENRLGVIVERTNAWLLHRLLELLDIPLQDIEDDEEPVGACRTVWFFIGNW